MNHDTYNTMIIDTEIIKFSDKGRKQLWCSLECDQCKQKFERRRRGFRITNRKPESKDFCNVTCLNEAKTRGGVLGDWVDKVQKSWKEKTGDDHPFKSKSVVEKRSKTWKNRYGTDHPWKSKDVRTSIEKTWIKKYGVDNPAKSHEIMSKIDQVSLHRKGHETRKKLGTYAKSKIEDKFYEVLCMLYGVENVERQVNINNWSIDFLVNKNLYVQFDGVHWHGLDRDIDSIKNSCRPVDVVIAKTYQRDIEQNKWFAENNLTLIRITDKEFKMYLVENP